MSLPVLLNSFLTDIKTAISSVLTDYEIRYGLDQELATGNQLIDDKDTIRLYMKDDNFPSFNTHEKLYSFIFQMSLFRELTGKYLDGTIENQLDKAQADQDMSDIMDAFLKDDSPSLEESVWDIEDITTPLLSGITQDNIINSSIQFKITITLD